MNTSVNSPRKGSVIATFPMVLIILIIVAGFMVDYGSLQSERSSMQNAADAAALAAAMRIGNINSEESREESLRYASAFANYNQRYKGDVLTADNIKYGKWNPSTQSFAASDGSEANAMAVTVIRGTDHSNYLVTPFMSFFGVNNITASTTSVAILSGSSSAMAVPVALRSPNFGSIVPTLTDANPSDDGPSGPYLNRFQVDEEVVVMMYGHENAAHLTLDFGASGPETSYAEVKDILSNQQDPVRMQVGDECPVLAEGSDPDEFASELLLRLDLSTTDPDRTIVMPIVEILNDSRGDDDTLDGNVRVGDFAPVYLDRTEKRKINNPEDPSKQINVKVIIGRIVTKRTNTDWGGASPSGVGGNTLRVIELVY